MRPRPLAAMTAPASSASVACSPGMNFRVARFTNALRRAKSFNLLLRAAASRMERPKGKRALGYSSELFEDLFRFLGIVADDRKLDQIIRDASYVNRLEVDALIAQSVRDIGEHARLVFERHEVDFALGEANVRRLERAARDDYVIGKNARHRCTADRNRSESFDVDTAPPECLRHSAEVSGMIRELDRAVSHSVPRSTWTKFSFCPAPRPLYRGHSEDSKSGTAPTHDICDRANRSSSRLCWVGALVTISLMTPCR